MSFDYLLEQTKIFSGFTKFTTNVYIRTLREIFFTFKLVLITKARFRLTLYLAHYAGFKASMTWLVGFYFNVHFLCRHETFFTYHLRCLNEIRLFLQALQFKWSWTSFPLVNKLIHPENLLTVFTFLFIPCTHKKFHSLVQLISKGSPRVIPLAPYTLLTL